MNANNIFKFILFVVLSISTSFAGKDEINLTPDLLQCARYHQEPIYPKETDIYKKTIIVNCTRFSVQDVKDFFRKYPFFKSIFLNNITDRYLQVINEINPPKLTSLSVNSGYDLPLQCESCKFKLAQIFLSSITNLKGLVHLKISSGNSVLNLVNISAFPNLQNLDITCSETDVVHLKNLKKLSSLTLDFTSHVQSISLEPLSELPSLNSLSISALSFEDKGLHYLANIPNLTDLTLTIISGKFQEKNLSLLSSLPYLSSLTLNCPLISPDLASIKDLHLSSLTLIGQSIDDETILSLNGLCIDELTLRCCSITDLSLKYFKQITYKKLSLTGCKKITTEVFSKFCGKRSPLTQILPWIE
ncbi:MAG: hypothetical protein C0412_19810 [Flavobacterium sp.]|nr:hypothetical protein [Flavobacterium sp.]